MPETFITAIRMAEWLMEACPELEPTSALKQAGCDAGVPDEQWGAYMSWANAKWFGA